MKTITQLSGTASEGEFTARGSISGLHLTDENCPGWHMLMQLFPDGLKLSARRPDGQAVVIPTAAILALARQHAPEVFATPEAIAEAQRADERIRAAAKPKN
jgi:hypothetical protein